MDLGRVGEGDEYNKNCVKLSKSSLQEKQKGIEGKKGWRKMGRVEEKRRERGGGEEIWFCLSRSQLPHLIEILSRFIYFPENFITSFLFTAAQDSTGHTSYILIAQFPVDGRLGWCHLLAIVTRAVINMEEQVSLCQDIEPFGYLPGSGIFGFYKNSIFNFFLRTLHSDFHCCWTSFYVHQE